MRRLWLIFSQAATVALAVLFVVGTLKPQWLVREGRPLTERSSTDWGALPDTITLYRRPILEEWIETEVSLDALVNHVVVHEVGHHFGLSDDDMHRIEDEA